MTKEIRLIKLGLRNFKGIRGFALDAVGGEASQAATPGVVKASGSEFPATAGAGRHTKT